MYSKYISAAHETSLNTADIGDILKTPRILRCIMQSSDQQQVSVFDKILSIYKNI